METKKKKLGKYDIKILQEIKLKNKKYFNLSRFCHDNKVSKGTISPALQRLIRYSMISQNNGFSYDLLPEGEYILVSNNRTIGARRVVRRKLKSIHSIEVYMDLSIKNVSALIDQLNPVHYHASYPKNWTQHNLTLSDGNKLIIKPHVTILQLKECNGRSWEEAEFRISSKIEGFIADLSKKGVSVSNVRVDYSHFADINSEFAKAIASRIGKYEKKLSDGTTYWIDYSCGDIESETDNPMLKEKLGDLINDVAMSDCRFSDIDDIAARLNKVEKIIVGIGKVEALRFKQRLESNPVDPSVKSDYIG